MKGQLQIIKGPDVGKTLDFKDNDYFLLGRNAQGSFAHYKLSPEDTYVSRNHCIFEIRPPKCFLVDNNTLERNQNQKEGR